MFSCTLGEEIIILSGCIFALLVVTEGYNPLIVVTAVGRDHTLLWLLEACLAAPCGHQQSILCVLTCYICIRRWISQHDTTKLVLLLEVTIGCQFGHSCHIGMKHQNKGLVGGHCHKITVSLRNRSCPSTRGQASFFLFSSCLLSVEL